MNFNQKPNLNREPVKAVCWEVGATPAAYLFSTKPKGQGGRQSWVPRSLVDHVTRFPAGPGEWRQCQVTMPMWLAEQKGLL